MIFVFIFLLNLLNVPFIEIVLHDLGDNLILLLFVLAHQQDLLVQLVITNLGNV